VRKLVSLLLSFVFADNTWLMEKQNDVQGPFSRHSPDDFKADPLLELDDPSLEPEFRALAQWLLDVHRWKLEQQRKTSTDDGIDNNSLIHSV